MRASQMTRLPQLVRCCTNPSSTKRSGSSEPTALPFRSDTPTGTEYVVPTARRPASSRLNSSECLHGKSSNWLPTRNIRCGRQTETNLKGICQGGRAHSPTGERNLGKNEYVGVRREFRVCLLY